MKRWKMPVNRFFKHKEHKKYSNGYDREKTTVFSGVLICFILCSITLFIYSHRFVNVELTPKWFGLFFLIQQTVNICHPNMEVVLIFGFRYQKIIQTKMDLFILLF